MEKLLLNVSYSDDTGKFWQESSIKNMVVHFKGGDIHDFIAEVIEEVDCVSLSYRNRPQTNVLRDKNKVIGYVYRGKSEIRGDNHKLSTALFDVWVEISKVEDYPIKNLLD